jgi:hypothetical protein
MLQSIVNFNYLVETLIRNLRTYYKQEKHGYQYASGRTQIDFQDNT